MPSYVCTTMTDRLCGYQRTRIALAMVRAGAFVLGDVAL